MMSAKFRMALVCLAFLVCALWSGLASAGPVGRVISITPGAGVQRAGQILTLELKSPVHDTDLLITDATGRVQVLFDDDSTITLGSNTRLALKTVVPMGRKPVFRVDLTQGLAKVITGKIVEKNPDGFTLSTPEATVGIRGTMFAVRAEKGRSQVLVFNTSRQVTVNGVDVAADYKITFPGGKLERLTPGDASQVGAQTASRPGAATTAANQKRDTLAASLDASGNGPIKTAGLAGAGQTQQNKESVADSLNIGSPSVIGSTTGPTQANITGTMTNTNMGNANVRPSGTFGFHADLNTGKITGATMSSSGVTGPNANNQGGGGPQGPTSYNLAGGQGNINGNHFYVNGFTSTGTAQWGGAAVSGVAAGSPVIANMDGTIVRGPSSMTVNGNYIVKFNDYTSSNTLDKGTLTGGGS